MDQDASEEEMTTSVLKVETGEASNYLDQDASEEEHTTSDDTDCFAQKFRLRRRKLGFTQEDVGRAVGYSQDTISRFENLTQTSKIRSKQKPLLKRWLEEAELGASTKNNATHQDRKRKCTSK